MGLIQDAFHDMGLFNGKKKKEEEDYEAKMKGFEKLEKELAENKAMMMKKMAEQKEKDVPKPGMFKIPEPPKMKAEKKPEEYKVEFVSDQEKPREEERQDRLDVLEQNLIAILQSMEDRIGALEQYAVKHS